MNFKKLLSIPILLGLPALVHGATYKVCDFEDYELGQTVKIWNAYSGESGTTAVVVADPANSANKVLRITNKGWNDHVEFELPEEFAGTKFSDKFETLSLKIRRHANDPCGEWKNFQFYLGEEKLHEESWPSYGDVSVWKTWKYEIPPVAGDNTSNLLRLGFNSDNSDYYIDDIVLSGPDFTVFEDGKLDFSNPSSTSSSYTKYDEGISIPAGTELDVYTSRYTYWMSPIRGAGRLNIHSGGERSYLGSASGAQHPDWSKFRGEINIYPWPEVNSNVKAGFYGVILGHGGTKFDPGSVKTSIMEGRFTQFLANNKVILRNGAAMAGEDGNTARAHRIGHLTAEAGSRIMGYYKGNKQKGVYYMVGADGSDSELAGLISAEGTSSVGIIKEGTGTYSITGNDNRITGFVTVVGGLLLISNDADAARENQLPGAVGIGENTTGVIVYTGGCLGGSGNISGAADVYGYMQPGDDKGLTLHVADYVNSNPIDVRLHPTSRLIFNIQDSDNAARLDVSGNVVYNKRDEAWDVSGAMPVLELRLADGASLKQGDTFTLISAAAKTSADVENWKFRIQYPKAYSWEVKELISDDGYTVTATVTSLDYSGQGDKVIEDEHVLDGGNEAFILDWNVDYDDPTPLREYASKAGKSIGVAVPVWRFDLNNSKNSKTATTAAQFNLVVAENEMKIDATEPSRGNFSLGSANELIKFANANDMDVRGHTLVWHSQVPGWISEDGKKNNHKWTKEQLLGIMRDHINGVAGALKGKVREWDVVNECLDDDQSVVWNDPTAYKLRASVWKDVIGEEFIEQAFRMAHEAAPDAELYLNDYGVEFMGQPKAEAHYNLAKKLVEKNVPIHGVGLQCHITTGQLDARKLKENIRRYQDLGLKCIITELDIAQADPKDANAARRQAEDYCATIMAALSQENCPTVLIWGLCDPDSWRENNPLIFDGSVKPKEAYYGVHAALRALAARSDVKDLPAAPSEKEIVATEYYNLQGMKVGEDAKGVVIKHIIYSDGSTRSLKTIRR